MVTVHIFPIRPLDSINTSRQWIALHSESVGKIYVDQGAEEAILYNGEAYYLQEFSK